MTTAEDALAARTAPRREERRDIMFRGRHNRLARYLVEALEATCRANFWRQSDDELAADYRQEADAWLKVAFEDLADLEGTTSPA